MYGSHRGHALMVATLGTVLTVVASVPAGPATAAAPSAQRLWQVQPTENPTTPTGYLTSVSCWLLTACAAVGYAEDETGNITTFAERRDGPRWTVAPTPIPTGSGQSVLDGVSCAAWGSCVAVGYYYDRAGTIHTLAERWTGSDWQLTATPNPAQALGSGLFAVSCASASACTAVGTYNRSDGTPATLAETWDGTRWAIAPPRNPAEATASQLSGVSCWAAHACIASGSYRLSSGEQLVLAERWDGRSWRIEPTPDAADAAASNLLSVSCPAPGSCTAAGYYNTSDGSTFALAETRDPINGWRLTATPQRARNSLFSAVSCSAAAACTAVGNHGSASLAERWNGTAWATQDAAAGAPTGLTAVACPGQRACTAVGFAVRIGNFSQVLVDNWDGSAWQPATAPNANGPTGSTFLDVSCVAAATCAGVGFTAAASGRSSSTLAERSTGGPWTIEDTPRSASLNSLLGGISCPSSSACTAVGYYLAGSRDRTLAEVWDGSGWSVQRTPNPPDATDQSDLRAVSCSSPQVCTAVGTYSDSTGTSDGFVEREDGGAWRLEDLPVPSHSTGTDLEGVSCAAATSCVAVGNYATRSGSFPLVESWDGTSWQLQHVPVPAGANGAQLLDVSCSSTADCTAVGGYVDSAGDQVTLTASRAGRAWALETSPNQPGAVTTVFNAVSCQSAGECTAVGYYNDLGPTGHILPALAFAATQHDARWTRQPIPSPPGTNSSELTGVSCLASGCTAVGYRFGSASRQLTFAIRRP